MKTQELLEHVRTSARKVQEMRARIRKSPGFELIIAAAAGFAIGIALRIFESDRSSSAEQVS